MLYPGIWKYWSSLPPDADDTAIGSLAVGLHPWLLVGRNVELLLRHRNDDGLFLTWFEGRTPDNDVDSVVNANVVAYLGNDANTRPTQEWLTSLVEGGGDLSKTTTYYKEDVELYSALVRASEYGRPAFAGLRPKLAAMIGNVRTEEGAYGDQLRTAQALDALATLEALPSSAHLDKRSISFFRDRRRAANGRARPLPTGPGCPTRSGPWPSALRLTIRRCVSGRCTRSRPWQPGNRPGTVRWGDGVSLPHSIDLSRSSPIRGRVGNPSPSTCNLRHLFLAYPRIGR